MYEVLALVLRYLSRSCSSSPLIAFHPAMDPRKLDVAIVGGGPAGLTASIWLARYLHSVGVVDSGDPRHWETRGINGFLGHPHTPPARLRGRGRDEARQSGVTLVDAVCERVTCHDEDHFEL